jgi:hypothetical protein
MKIEIYLFQERIPVSRKENVSLIRYYTMRMTCTHITFSKRNIWNIIKIFEQAMQPIQSFQIFLSFNFYSKI